MLYATVFASALFPPFSYAEAKNKQHIKPPQYNIVQVLAMSRPMTAGPLPRVGGGGSGGRPGRVSGDRGFSRRDASPSAPPRGQSKSSLSSLLQQQNHNRRFDPPPPGEEHQQDPRHQHPADYAHEYYTTADGDGAAVTDGGAFDGNNYEEGEPEYGGYTHMDVDSPDGGDGYREQTRMMLDDDDDEENFGAGGGSTASATGSRGSADDVDALQKTLTPQEQYQLQMAQQMIHQQQQQQMGNSVSARTSRPGGASSGSASSRAAIPSSASLTTPSGHPRAVPGSNSHTQSGRSFNPSPTSLPQLSHQFPLPQDQQHLQQHNNNSPPRSPQRPAAAPVLDDKTFNMMMGRPQPDPSDSVPRGKILTSYHGAPTVIGNSPGILYNPSLQLQLPSELMGGGQQNNQNLHNINSSILFNNANLSLLQHVPTMAQQPQQKQDQLQTRTASAAAAAFGPPSPPPPGGMRADGFTACLLTAAARRLGVDYQPLSATRNRHDTSMVYNNGTEVPNFTHNNDSRGVGSSSASCSGEGGGGAGRSASVGSGSAIGMPNNRSSATHVTASGSSSFTNTSAAAVVPSHVPTSSTRGGSTVGAGSGSGGHSQQQQERPMPGGQTHALYKGYDAAGLRRLIEIQGRALGVRHWSVTTVLDALGDRTMLDGEPALAEQYYTEAQRRATYVSTEETYPPEYQAAISAKLGAFFAERGKWDQASDMFATAADIARTTQHAIQYRTAAMGGDNSLLLLHHQQQQQQQQQNKSDNNTRIDTADTNDINNITIAAQENLLNVLADVAAKEGGGGRRLYTDTSRRDLATALLASVSAQSYQEHHHTHSATTPDVSPVDSPAQQRRKKHNSRNQPHRQTPPHDDKSSLSDNEEEKEEEATGDGDEVTEDGEREGETSLNYPLNLHGSDASFIPTNELDDDECPPSSGDHQHQTMHRSSHHHAQQSLSPTAKAAAAVQSVRARMAANSNNNNSVLLSTSRINSSRQQHQPQHHHHHHSFASSVNSSVLSDKSELPSQQLASTLQRLNRGY